ncbi:VWA domain-containing protein, partial [Acidobacteriota bacterium]
MYLVRSFWITGVPHKGHAGSPAALPGRSLAARKRPVTCLPLLFFAAFLLICPLTEAQVQPPYCSEIAPDGTVVEVRIDSPLPGDTIIAAEPCPDIVEVTGVASTIGIPPLLDLFFVIDVSGSTSDCSGVDVDGDGITCWDPNTGQWDQDDSILGAEVAAVRNVVNAVDPAHVRVALITFASSARTWLSLTSDFPLVFQTLNQIMLSGPGGSTDFVDAIDELRTEFARSADPLNRLPSSFFLSDGKDKDN